MGFNRTFMELKYGATQAVTKFNGGFNRTFMELKSLKRLEEKSYDASFNRTFMELKYWCCRLSNHLREVLIVPLWN